MAKFFGERYTSLHQIMLFCHFFSNSLIFIDIKEKINNLEGQTGITFSGGDPLYQVEAFTELARRIKEETGKNIWCYTGFKYEEILEDERLRQILPYIDTLVDGPFIAELRDPDLPFRGSSNQIIITLHKWFYLIKLKSIIKIG